MFEKRAQEMDKWLRRLSFVGFLYQCEVFGNMLEVSIRSKMPNFVLVRGKGKTMLEALNHAASQIKIDWEMVDQLIENIDTAKNTIDKIEDEVDLLINRLNIALTSVVDGTILSQDTLLGLFKDSIDLIRLHCRTTK